MPYAGALITNLSSLPIIPGIYFSVENVGGSNLPSIRTGRVVALFRASAGPMTPQVHTSVGTLQAMYGVSNRLTNRSNVAINALRNGATDVMTARYGSGGAAGTAVLNNVGAAPALDWTNSNVGNTTTTLTVQVDPFVAGTRRLLVSSPLGPTETYRFAAGAAGGEAQAALLAVQQAGGSRYGTLTLHAGYVATTALALANVTTTGGTDPTADAAGLSAALLQIAKQPWNYLVVDAEDNTTFNTILGFMQSQEQAGRRRWAVVGQDPAVVVADATRAANGAALNSYLMLFVNNSVYDSDGVTILAGMDAAAATAGKAAQLDISGSLTAANIGSAIAYDLDDSAGTSSPMGIAIADGNIVFQTGPNGTPEIVQGINTYISRDAGHDAGWSSHMRVSIRFRAMDLVALEWATLRGKVRNNRVGQARVVAAAVTVLQSLFTQGVLSGYKVMVDPDHTSQGNVMYVVIQLDDTDMADFVIGRWQFEYAPSAGIPLAA